MVETRPTRQGEVPSAEEADLAELVALSDPEIFSPRNNLPDFEPEEVPVPLGDRPAPLRIDLAELVDGAELVDRPRQCDLPERFESADLLNERALPSLVSPRHYRPVADSFQVALILGDPSHEPIPARQPQSVEPTSAVTAAENSEGGQSSERRACPYPTCP